MPPLLGIYKLKEKNDVMRNEIFKIKHTVLISIIVVLQSCGNVVNCKIDGIKTLYSVRTIKGNNDTIYAHHVLLKGISKKCIDSVMMVNIVNKYIDTLTRGKPANIISFYSTDIDFDLSETSQTHQVLKHCLVQINIDDQTKKITSYLFYNESGDVVYWGNMWRPNGDKKL